MRKITFALIILASLLLSACAASASSNVPTAAPGSAAPASRVISEGRLEPASYLEASFSLPGQVAEVLVQDGQAVSKGQPLARLNSSPDKELVLARARQEALAAHQSLDQLKTNARLNLAQAEAAVVAAQIKVDQDQKRVNSTWTDESQAQLAISKAQLELAQQAFQSLKDTGGVDADALAAAQARLDSAEAGLSAAQAALDALTLTAPQDGVVVDLALKPGQNVTAGLPVIFVADPAAWVVKTDNLTETQVVQVRTGQKVSVTLDALPDLTLNGEVTRINSRYEEKRGDITYTVTVTLNQVDPQARWGMTAAITFEP